MLQIQPAIHHIQFGGHYSHGWGLTLYSPTPPAILSVNRESRAFAEEHGVRFPRGYFHRNFDLLHIPSECRAGNWTKVSIPPGKRYRLPFLNISLESDKDPLRLPDIKDDLPKKLITLSREADRPLNITIMWQPPTRRKCKCDDLSTLRFWPRIVVKDRDLATASSGGSEQ
ncbi:hypothetical protein FSPOR_8023 [Fusarium sporotrichioides]|uniref:Uncharacterized protein n=1 Tax=Fusarium sporotrichioides TaxID=5514 RepID=A0A395RW20_FUSSP|nr:hypothetical protein FSPOR_8023 [Fusarium sporotrichioides]